MKDVIDAKFQVISGPRRRWRIWFDWRNFAIVGGLALLGGLRAWLNL